MRVSTIIFLLLINACFGQSDQRSILEVFLENETHQLYDFECTFVMNGEVKEVITDQNGFFLFPFSDYQNQEITVNIHWDRNHVLIPNLRPESLMNTHVEVLVNGKADSSCVYVSYYYGCTITPAVFRKECPEGHEVNIFTIPIISETLYRESDSIAKHFGITLEKYWFDGIKFTSKEAYIKWIQSRRKND